MSSHWWLPFSPSAPGSPSWIPFFPVAPHLDLGEKLAEAGTGVHLQALGQLQDELHDDGLVGHLFHERAFLGGEKQA